MKTKICISFRAETIPGEAATILEATGCGPDVAKVADYSMFGVRDISVTLRLDETDERGPKVLALLQQHGVEVESFLYDEYSEEDRQQARLLWMAVEPDWWVVGGVSEGTKYDMSNACPNCNAGAKQTSVFYIDERAHKTLRKCRATATTEDVILIDGGMRKKLVDAGVTGISFGDVRVRHENKKWSAVARDQILIDHVMPPMRGELKAEDEQYLCKVCRRGGRMTSPNAPYREEDFIGIQDFNLTWEWFGEFWPEDKEKGKAAGWPSPGILVTPKVMNIFVKAGVKAFSWKPVNVAP